MGTTRDTVSGVRRLVREAGHSFFVAKVENERSYISIRLYSPMACSDKITEACNVFVYEYLLLCAFKELKQMQLLSLGDCITLFFL
jgi:hypothetical protein